MAIVKLIYLGDIFGEPGRRAVKHFIPKLRDELDLDLVLANCENAANGRGISTRMMKELLDCGVDFMTSGNHIFYVHEFFKTMNERNCPVLRPYNFSTSCPGKGIGVVETKNGVKVGVMNLMGRVFMEPGVNLPMQAFEEAYLELKQDCDFMVLDFHAETTSEKRAMGWFVDGKVSLMVGTHTHIQTADEEILPNGTAYITDMGMTGPYDSVIGMKKEIIIKRLRHQLSSRFEVATDDIRLCGVYVEIDTVTKKAIKIERIVKRLDD